MEPIQKKTKEYFSLLKERVKKSRIHQPHQLAGLEIAEVLEDKNHISLYIKLAKKYGGGKLSQLAKSIAENKNVKNKGAYFMRLLQKSH